MSAVVSCDLDRTKFCIHANSTPQPLMLSESDALIVLQSLLYLFRTEATYSNPRLPSQRALEMPMRRTGLLGPEASTHNVVPNKNRQET